MSKAFTRESDDVEESPAVKQSPPALPFGAKNYITPQGLQKLRDELEQLTSSPIAPSKRQRISELQRSIETAVPIEPPPLPWDQVLFGATVAVRNQQSETATYRIVGVDETDLDRNHISWLSPVAKALLKARVGDHVRFRTPAGEQEIEIVGIQYEQ